MRAYAKTFGTTMNSVNSNLPAAAVEERSRCTQPPLGGRDAQKAGDAAKTATTLRAAVQHMSGTPGHGEVNGAVEHPHSPPR